MLIMFSNTFTTRFTLSVLCFVYIRNCLEADDQFMKFWDNYIMSMHGSSSTTMAHNKQWSTVFKLVAHGLRDIGACVLLCT